MFNLGGKFTFSGIGRRQVAKPYTNTNIPQKTNITIIVDHTESNGKRTELQFNLTGESSTEEVEKFHKYFLGLADKRETRIIVED